MSAAHKRLCNFRLPFAAALAMVCGVAAAYACALYRIDYLYLTAAAPVAAAIFAVAAISRRSVKTLAYIAVVALFFAVGAAYAAAVFAKLASLVPPDGEVLVSGRVEDVRFTSSGGVYFILSRVTADGVQLPGRLLVYPGGAASGALEPGYSVSFRATVSAYELFSYGRLNYNAADGIYHFAEVSGAFEYSYGFSLFGGVRSAIYDVLFKNLDFETASVVYAMITGGTQDMSQNTLDAFRYGGVAHIFAVSGMNVSILFAAIVFVLKKLRAGRWVSSIAAIAAVFFYVGVCGFTLSAVRAAVMCAVAALSSLAFAKYDQLNSLSLSVIIILLVNPLNLFDVGFILSVAAMLGIIFLCPNINRLLARLPSGLRQNISMSLASQAATFPTLMLTFGYISGAGLILNIIVVPVISLLYILLFACTVFCMVVPPAAAFVLPASALPLQAVINFFVEFGFEDSLISGTVGWPAAAAVFVAIAVASDKLNLRLRVRAAICAVCAAVFVFGCIGGGVGAADNSYSALPPVQTLCVSRCRCDDVSARPDCGEGLQFLCCDDIIDTRFKDNYEIYRT